MIKKRYSDFVRLRRVLTDVFYFKVVPVLPPKNLRAKFQKQKDFFHQRARGLKRFLTLVLEDAEMFDFKAVRDFFTDENEFNVYFDIYYGGETQMGKVYKSQSKFFSSALRTVKSLAGLGEAPRQFEAKDVIFVQLEREIGHLASFLSNHLEHVTELRNGFQSLKKNYAEVLGMLRESAPAEPDAHAALFAEARLPGFEQERLCGADPKIERLRGGLTRLAVGGGEGGGRPEVLPAALGQPPGNAGRRGGLPRGAGGEERNLPQVQLPAEPEPARPQVRREEAAAAPNHFARGEGARRKKWAHQSTA